MPWLIKELVIHLSYQNVDKLHVIPCKMSKGVNVSTLLEENIDIDDVYRKVILGVMSWG